VPARRYVLLGHRVVRDSLQDVHIGSQQNPNYFSQGSSLVISQFCNGLLQINRRIVHVLLLAHEI